MISVCSDEWLSVRNKLKDEKIKDFFSEAEIKYLNSMLNGVGKFL